MEDQKDFDQQEFDEQDFESDASSFGLQLAEAKRKVMWPAIALIIIAAVSIAMVTLGLGMDVYLINSGALERVRPPKNMTNEQQLWARVTWSVVLLGANIAVLMGAVRMLNLRSRRSAMVACIVSVVPCVGPCFILGIPFGIWGIIVLNDAGVTSAFEEQGRRNRRGLYR